MEFFKNHYNLSNHWEKLVFIVQGNLKIELDVDFLKFVRQGVFEDMQEILS